MDVLLAAPAKAFFVVAVEFVPSFGARGDDPKAFERFAIGVHEGW
jgi:hypothetical protein